MTKVSKESQSGAEDEPFKWTKEAELAVSALAEGLTIKEAAELSGVSDRTINRWKQREDFTTRLQKLVLETGVAIRAERMMIIKQQIRKALKKRSPSKKDLLDWLKQAQAETDGSKLNLDVTKPVELVHIYVPDNGRNPQPKENDGDKAAIG